MLLLLNEILLLTKISNINIKVFNTIVVYTWSIPLHFKKYWNKSSHWSSFTSVTHAETGILDDNMSSSAIFGDIPRKAFVKIFNNLCNCNDEDDEELFVINTWFNMALNSDISCMW